MDILGPGDNDKLLWSVMALLERIEQTGDFSLSVERYILAENAGFKLRKDNGWVLGPDQETTRGHQKANGGGSDEKTPTQEDQAGKEIYRGSAFTCGHSHY